MFVDSSFLAGLGRGEESAVAFLDRHEDEPFATSTVVAYELFGGLVAQGHGDLVDELRRDLGWVEFVPFQLRDAAEAARIEAALESEGERIPVPDAMIAATARNRGAELVAADEHFDRVPELEYVDFRAA